MWGYIVILLLFAISGKIMYDYGSIKAKGKADEERLANIRRANSIINRASNEFDRMYKKNKRL